ncbi:hypothetical protein G6F56_014273 [Rhizopus delemar]|nr:hypothetical protein G6F56_014273 [Rhizopus delemar]
MPQQGVAAGARITRFAHQHVQHQAGQVVGHRLHVQVLVLIEDLAVRVAVVAGLRSHGAFTYGFAAVAVHIGQGAVGNVLAGGAALAALHAHEA